MNIQPTLEPHYHQEFRFADNTDSSGWCCCWKSKTKEPKEYFVDPNGVLHGRNRNKYRDRILANQRLCELIKAKFEDDPIENDKAFERLKLKINDPMSNGDPITSEKLAKIVIAIHELKQEFNI